jgi:hypothetical protein
LLGQNLEWVLEEFALPHQRNLLQCTDDLLLSGLTEKEVNWCYSQPFKFPER